MVDSITGIGLAGAHGAKPLTMVKPAGSVAGGAPSFADFLSEAADNSVAISQRSEKLGAQAVAKQAELVDVISAVSNAEVTLDTVLTIRDRLIQAYQEIIKTPI